MRAGQYVWIGVCCLLVAACGAVPPPSAQFAPTSSPAPVGETNHPVPVDSGPAASGSRWIPPTAPGSVASWPRLATPSPLPLGVACRLPYADMSEATGGFIYYPSGERHADPAATVALPGNTPGQVGVNPGLTYIAAVDKWFPVPFEWVSPEGSYYVYQDFSSHKIHGVTTSDGSVHELTSEDGWEILGVSKDEVFLGKLNTPGVWVLVGWAAPIPVVDHGTWQKFSHHAVWGIDQSGNLVSHSFGLSQAETTWGQVPASSWIAGFDLNGDPIVNTGGMLRIFHADKSSTTVWPGTNALSAGGRVFADANGLWFEVGGGLVDAPGHGIYLWTPQTGAKRVGPELHPAGACGP